MPNNRDKRNELTAAILTALLSALTIAVLLLVNITYNGSGQTSNRTWPPVDSAELLFGGEYVLAGNLDVVGNDEPTPIEEVEMEASALPSQVEVDNPTPTPEPLAVQQQPSPAKASPTVASEAKTAKEDKETEQERNQTRRDIASRTNKFGGSGTGRQGNPDGNSDRGVLTGSPGASLGNRTYLGGGECSSRVTGKITVSIQVNREGKVTSATIIGGTPPASSNAAQRATVLKKAHQARFSPSQDAPVSQKGTLTYIFK